MLSVLELEVQVNVRHLMWMKTSQIFLRIWLSLSLSCVFILLIKFVPFKVKNVYVHSNYFLTYPFFSLFHTSFSQFLCGVHFPHSWLLFCDPLILTRTFCMTSCIELFIRVANILAKIDKTLRAPSWLAFNTPSSLHSQCRKQQFLWDNPCNECARS